MNRAPSRRFFSILGVAFLLLVLGSLFSQQDLVAPQMTYGNFDIPMVTSFVNRLLPGIPDHASGKEYRFDQIHWHPFIGVILVIFPLMLFWGLYKNREEVGIGISRVWSQWAAFVIARLGVIRASQISPVRRSCFGIFPFLNCQACEMASGACPIGMFQNLLSKSVLPLHLLGSMMLFGVVLGKSICGWLCPFGFISDLMSRIRFRETPIPRSLGYIRFYVLAAVVAGPLLYAASGMGDRNFFCSTFCGSGKIYGLLPYWFTVGAPSFPPAGGTLPEATGGVPVLWIQVALTLLLLVAMLFISGRVFCRVLCPLGGFWGLFNGYSLVGIRHRDGNCTGCGRCESVCPMGVSKHFSGFLDRTSCMTCGRCVPACSSGAREFRWGLPDRTTVEGPEPMSEKVTFDYGSFFNRIRRDFYILAMSLIAKNPLDMARYAFDNTAFYRRLFGRPPEEFGSLPLTRKKDLGTADPYDVLSQEYAGKVAYYGETTGSTGYPTPSFLTESEFRGARVFSRITPYVGALEEVLAENRAVVNGLTFGFTIAGMSFGDFLMSHGGVIANIGSRSTIATPPRTARVLTRLRPSVLTGTPIDILCWLRILREDFPQEYPKVLEFLKVALSTAELCSASRSRAIQKEFNLVHIDIYACVEGFFSLPCPCGEKHVLPAYHAEIVDQDLKPLGPVGEGRFVYTNLVKKSSPLVRYLLDDFVTLFPSRCPFGFRKSVEPHGRYELTVMHEGRRLGVRHFEEAIFRYGLFGDYRVVMEDDSISFRIEEYGTHEPVSAIRDGLGDIFRKRVEVELVPFGTITNYREVRQSKPILKVEDKRSSSTQKIPEYL